MYPQNKFNLLLIHDDGKTLKYRVSGRILQFLILAALILVVGGIGGIWFGSVLWNENSKLSLAEQTLQQDMAKLRMQLERLSNMEELLARGKSLATEIAMAPMGGIDAEPAEQEASAEDEEEFEQAQPTNSSAANTIKTSDLAANPDLSEVNTKAVRVENMVARSSNGRTRISMDLHNDTQIQISGNALFSLITENGERILLRHDDQFFRISRFKKVVANVALPATAGNLAKATLLVEIKSSDDTLMFRKIYPFNID